MMACDGYDITLTYDDVSETDSAFYSDSADSDEMDCSDQPSMSCKCNMDGSIRLEMSRHPSSMKQVVNIVIAVNRMKHVKTVSSEFGAEQVLDMIMDRVIQEHHMERVVTPSYTKTNQTVKCNVCDQFKKTLVQSTGSPRLLAVTLRDGNNRYKVDFSLSLYASTSATPNASQPVCLAISQTNLYLACTTLDDASPHLVLKEISETLNTIKVGDQNDNLLFFRKETGVANNTFESVKYPGWFISTAYEDFEQVDMSQMSKGRFTNFTLEKKQLIRS
ncbi:interleukin-1 beta [Pimephales promelas]|uniref:interleukin-1 beta n=1 Tax=Pimephales promelas TaxID=90988 RepID=UPI001955E47E|nr:interleukin-1 beta [Pimephales promelas]KAG1971362.1 interleukin-1 beta [Pimephales promelas]KAG1971363.1 interleukin-1 beta [Pimephales promelas]